MLMRSSINILFLRLNSLYSHPLQTGEVLQPPQNFCVFHWTVSCCSTFLMYWGPKTGDSAPGFAYIFNSFLLYYYWKHYLCNHDSTEGNRKGACFLMVFSEQDQASINALVTSQHCCFFIFSFILHTQMVSRSHIMQFSASCSGIHGLGERPWNSTEYQLCDSN